MPNAERPMKYRVVKTIDAFRVNQDNLETVARWCGGRVVDDHSVPVPRDNPIYPKVVQVPFFNTAGNIDVATAREGDYVIKNEDGTHNVWSAKAFAEQGFEPFNHRGRGADKSDPIP